MFGNDYYRLILFLTSTRVKYILMYILNIQKYMLQTLKILKNEAIINIKELQKSPSQYLKGITRILKGKKTIGFFLDVEIFENLIEDLEAMNSPKYLDSIKRARDSKDLTSLSEVNDMYGV